MFTLEIDGKAVAVTDADEDEARELFASRSFKDDLMSLESEGRPLWDGAAALHVRSSLEEEIDAFDEAISAVDEDDGDEEGGIGVLFLVPIVQVEDRAAPDRSADQGT